MAVIFSPEQKAAIDPMTVPLGSPGAARVGCLIGPPGSGKTSISQEVMRLWRAMYGLDAITALSPTGKAARRFIEVTGFPCSTIHRMLIEWERSEGEGVSDDMRQMRAVIIDESSMIDQYLAERLLAVLPPSVERVLFVGDADQLPSVGPGCVLRDMMASGKVPVWKLTRIFRQSEHSWIKVNAQRINQGQRPVVDPASEDYFEHVCETHDEVRAKVVELCKANPSAQVLVPGRRFPIGAMALNEVVRETVNPERGRPGWKAGDIVFHSNDRVIHKKNNYKLGVMNGETGTAVAVETHEINGKPVLHLVVDYSDRRVLYPPEVASKELKLAYALTVHSSQGSEFQQVIVVLHSSHSFLLSRELFYTACTRARQKLWVVGDEKAIKLAVAKPAQRKRKTLLTERIQASCKALEI